MSQSPLDLRLRLYSNWANRRQDLGTFINQAKGYLEQIRKVHPLFGRDLHYLGSSRKQSPALGDDLSNLDAAVLAQGWDREATRSKYSRLSNSEEVTLESMSELGFWFSVGNLDHLDRGNVTFTFSEGSASNSHISGCGIDLPLKASDEFLDLVFLKRLLDLVIENWSPRYAGVLNTALSRACFVAGSKPYALPIGWLNYCQDARVAEALPADIARERFGQDGVLFRLQDKAPIDDIESTIKTALRVRDALLPGQWMSHEEDRTVNRR